MDTNIGRFLKKMLRYSRNLFAFIFVFITISFPGLSSASVLIISPHPDDDVLSAAGIIYNALQRHESVTVVYITNGDINGVSTGYVRQDEAVASEVEHLGMNEDNLIFLGYPDGCLFNVFYNYVNQNDQYVSPNGQSVTYGNRGLGRSDYHSYRYGSPAPYNRYNMRMDLEDIISIFRPDHIFITCEFDNHLDHSTTYELLTEALFELSHQDSTYIPVIHKTIIHAVECGWPQAGNPTTYLTEVPQLSSTNLLWSNRESYDVPYCMQSTTLDVNPKYQAITAHQSQGGAGGFLGQFFHKDEIFWAENILGSNQPPVVNAGTDQVVSESASVQLDGSTSFDPESGTLTYQWQQTAGTTVQLSDPTATRPTFIAPSNLIQDETLSFQLIVSDGQFTSMPDSVNITVQTNQTPPTTGSNIAPLATVTASSQAAAYEQLATKTVDGFIDGYPGDYTREWATSGERSGAWLTLQWNNTYLVDRIVLYDRPNSSDQILSATISFSDGSTLQVGPLNNYGSATEYTFSSRIITGLTLTVTSVSGSTLNIGLSEMEVYGSSSTNPVNHQPIANTGSDQVVSQATTVQLNGSASSDSDGDVLTFRWQQTAGTTVQLSNPTDVHPTFTAPGNLTQNQTLTFELIVNDGQLDSAPAFVNITVQTDYTNQTPIANSGSDQVVSQSAIVQLDGSTSFDPEGSTLTYQWQQTAGTMVQLSNPTAARPTFTAPSNITQDQTIIFQLTVNDGQLTSEPDYVNIAVLVQLSSSNITLSASIAASSQASSYQQLATKAIDGIIDGYPGDYTKEWATSGEINGAWINLQWNTPYLVDQVVLYDRPNADDQILIATISFSDGSTLQVGPLNNNGSATTYTFASKLITSLRLTVDITSGTSHNIGLSEIEVYGVPSNNTVNHSPTANAGDNQVVSTSVAVQLNGSASSDPDGDVLTFQWHQTSGATVQLSAPTAARPTFSTPSNLSQDQILTFQLIVSDGLLTSAPSYVNITVQANQTQPASSNIAGLATVTVSSQASAYQQLATKAVDGVIDGYPGDYTKEWATSGERNGAWINLLWNAPYLVDRIMLYDRPNSNDQILSATIRFGDGSALQVGPLNNNGTATEYSFAAKLITGLTLTVNSVSGSTQNVGLSEIEVYGTQSQ